LPVRCSTPARTWWRSKSSWAIHRRRRRATMTGAGMRQSAERCARSTFRIRRAGLGVRS